MHTGIWSWVTLGRPSCAHLRVVLPSAPEAIPTRWEGLLHQAKTGFKKRQNRVRQLTSTDIPSLPNLDDTGSLLTDLPSAYCDYEDDTELTQATWPSPQEHAPDAPPCPHIAPSRPRHLPKYLYIYNAVRSAGLESHSNIIFISKPGGITRPSTMTMSFLIIWSTGSHWGTCWEICQPQVSPITNLPAVIPRTWTII